MNINTRKINEAMILKLKKKREKRECPEGKSEKREISKWYQTPVFNNPPFFRKINGEMI